MVFHRRRIACFCSTNSAELALSGAGEILSRIKQD
jgi:hypothetical protein